MFNVNRNIPLGVRNSLNIIHDIAMEDDVNACISYPKGDLEAHNKAVGRLNQQALVAEYHKFYVVSFDIDLTLDMGLHFDDYPELSLINPAVIPSLQQEGHIVGTCSDISPSYQLNLMYDLGFEPNFYIPKEMLEWVKKLIPARSHIHVGDDYKRDREIALRAGWVHQYPWEFNIE